ncbi:thioredoxin domain-containing protein [Thermopolyspora sp. NPDC052614]|uniref:DsbA family protein n=1 Tax=Thermopolyspora sp. NPDC052614 TaxID=3155682 RepID=UPI0034420C75
MGNAARKATREKARLQRELERKREQRRRQVTITLSVIGVVALIVALVAIWQSTRNKSEAYAGSLAPISRQADGDVVMAKAGVNSPVLDIYEDFQCPYCKVFEESSGDTIKRLAAEGKVKVVYHPITLFSQEPLKGNSLRAATALRCVQGGEPWIRLHDRFFAEQPDEGTVGFAVGDIVTWGKEAGVTDAGFENCVRGQQGASAQLAYSSETIKADKIDGTPSVRLNGKDLGDAAYVAGSLESAVLSAK